MLTFFENKSYKCNFLPVCSFLLLLLFVLIFIIIFFVSTDEENMVGRGFLTCQTEVQLRVHNAVEFPLVLFCQDAPSQFNVTVRHYNSEKDKVYLCYCKTWLSILSYGKHYKLNDCSWGKHLFCFPRISMFSRDKVKGNIEIWGKQN